MMGIDPFALVFCVICIAVVAITFQQTNRAARRAVTQLRIEDFRRRVLNGDYDDHPSNINRNGKW